MLAQRNDVFFGVGIRSTHRSGKADDVSSIGAFFVDLDKGTASADRFSLLPSMTVESGTPGHEQRYWLLRVPVDTTDPRERARWELINKALAQGLDGDKGFDLPRIMRIPGTKNHKTKPARPIVLLEIHPDRRYTIEEVEDALKQLGAFPLPSATAPSSPSPRKAGSPPAPAAGAKAGTILSTAKAGPDIAKLDIARTNKRYILNGAARGRRSGTDWRAVKALVRAGMSDEAIIDIFVNNPIGAKTREEGLPYLERTIARVRSYYKLREKAKRDQKLQKLPEILEIAQKNGGRIPSMRWLGDQLGVSRQAATKHVNRLVEEGVLEEDPDGKQGKSYKLL